MRIFLLFFPAALYVAAQSAEPGRLTFESRCARCHGADGKGGELGPAIVGRLAARNDQQLATLVREGLPQQGMPPNQVNDDEMAQLTLFLRTLQPRAPKPLERLRVTMINGMTLEGEVLNRGMNDLQLRTSDQRVRLLRRSGDRYREVTSEVGWHGYNGDPGGNRFTTLSQITKENVSRLAPKWVFSLPNTGRLQVTPVVMDGIMYVAGPNECYALDAGTGRQIWRFQQPRTRGVISDAAQANNRGVAVAGNRVFMVTDGAHVLALDRFTGAVQWDSEMADYRQNYFATSAPLAAGTLVISGVSGGEEGANGVVVAFDQTTGKEAWRFHAVPLRGEPGSETWQGKDIDHGGAPTWFTGTYDSQTQTVYWPTGNPGAEYNGENRKGDNLYSDSILALDLKTGKLKWYYQFTPHDLWDWDATETPMLLDIVWQGQPRKLLVQANRNGFFYIFDRTNGKLLLAKPFVRNLTWASGIGPDGRPILNPNQEPTAEGTLVCPSQDGASNWFSPSFNPATGLFYAQTFEKCSVYTKRDAGEWQAGKQYLGGSQRTAPDRPAERVLKAIDIQTGEIKWELPQPGPAESWGGTLATATGLVIFGEENGALVAADAVTGKPLWSFETNQLWKASPMTYMFDRTQYIAVAAGSNILAFALLQ
jgi:alcohol dehydrogenase (cytochrome c)